MQGQGHNRGKPTLLQYMTTTVTPGLLYTLPFLLLKQGGNKKKSILLQPMYPHLPQQLTLSLLFKIKDITEDCSMATSK